MRQFSLLYFILVVAVFAGSCGDTETCPSDPVQSFDIVRGPYNLSQTGSAELEQGRPVLGQLTIFREEQTAVLQYTLEDQRAVVEEYSFETPDKKVVNY